MLDLIRTPARTLRLFGAVLGTGIFTRIPTGAFYVTLCCAFLAADPTAGALLMGAFGIGRALPLFVIEALVDDPDELPLRTGQVARLVFLPQLTIAIALSFSAGMMFARVDRIM